MDTVIHTKDLCKTLGGKRAVERLDLAVPRGAIFALLGDNGAGKSTTIRMLTGQLQPDAGAASVLGADCWADAVALRLRVGYVPEKPRYYDWMTADEIGSFAAGFHRPGFRSRYLGLLARSRVEPGARLKSLSKGGYARVGLALALACEPEVLILDEPTSGLDLFARREFLDGMVELAAQGHTILISSHAVAELERVASHAAFLAEGRLLLSASLEDFRRRVLRVRVRHDGSVAPGSGLSDALDVESSGREWQAALLDPDRGAIDGLRNRPGVLSLEEGPLTLEQTYVALLARSHARPAGRGERAELAPAGGRP